MNKILRYTIKILAVLVFLRYLWEINETLGYITTLVLMFALFVWRVLNNYYSARSETCVRCRKKFKTHSYMALWCPTCRIKDINGDLKEDEISITVGLTGDPELLRGKEE
jgi:hypothetical protein